MTLGSLFRLDLVKDLSGDPPDEAALLAGLSDDRARAEPTNLPYLDYLDRLAALERLLRSEGWWPFPHPWLTTFVGDAAVEAVAAGELAKLTPADLGPLGQVVISRSSGSRSGRRCCGCRRTRCATRSTSSGSRRPTMPSGRGGW